MQKNIRKWVLLLVISVMPVVIFGIFYLTLRYQWMTADYHYPMPMLGVDVFNWKQGFMMDIALYFELFQIVEIPSLILMIICIIKITKNVSNNNK